MVIRRMEKITIGEAQKLTAPNPFALIGTCDADGRANFMALSWWTYASNRPGTMVVCMSQRGYSSALIKQNSEFTVNIIGEDLAEAAFACGCASGRNVNKVAQLHIPTTASECVAPPCIEGSRVCFECKVTQQLAVGDHDLFVAEVAAIRGDASKPQLFAWNGYAKLGTVKA